MYVCMLFMYCMYSSESTQRELLNEYKHDMFQMVFKDLCVLVLWTKVASALKGLRVATQSSGAQSIESMR